MSFNRKAQDHKKGKVNNLVAKHDHNVGGFHGKSKKAQRASYKQTLNQYDLDDLLEGEFDDYEQDDYE